ncbi:MAG: NlpC/P60 family protein [Pseudomonadota bacterium]
MDRRRTAFNGRVAAAHLEGQVDAERFVDGKPQTIAVTIADMLDKPEGRRDRQLVRGETFVALDVVDGWVYGYAERDGYAGWIDGSDFVHATSDLLTHKVSAAQTYGKSSPGLKEMGRVTPLSFGVRLAVMEDAEGWARVSWTRGAIPQDLYVPSGHLAAVDYTENDPIDVAERLLGTPYLWGGNSSFGTDCSGLVQMACLACGIPCPGDADMQEKELGVPLPEDVALQRGDLLFWKGHVAWLADADTLIHANAYHMATAYEPLDAALTRIEAQGDGPVTTRKRLE